MSKSSQGWAQGRPCGVGLGAGPRGLALVAVLLLATAPGGAGASPAAGGYALERSLQPNTMVPAGARATYGVLSPDGAAVAYVGPGPEGHAALHLVPASGGPSRVLWSGNHDVGRPAWSPDGTFLYVHANPLGVEKIYAVRVADGAPTQMTFGASHDLHPTLSADGRRLAFDSDREGGHDIWALDLPAGTPRRITMDRSTDFFPTLSPDGATVAFVSHRSGAWKIWAKPLDGGPAYPLTKGRSADSHPHATPDGRHVLFDSDHGASTGLWRVSWGGGRAQRVPTPPAGRAAYPTATADGRSVLFVSESAGVATIERARLPEAGQAPGRVASLDAPARARPAPRPAARPADVGVQLASAADPTRPSASGGPEVGGVSLAPPPSRFESGAIPLPPRREAVGAAAVAPAVVAGEGGLRILSFVPVGTRPAGPDANVFVAFATDVRPVARWEDAARLLDSRGRPVPAEVVYNPGLRRLEVRPLEPLAPGASFRVELPPGQLVGRGGEAFRGFQWEFRRDGRGDDTEIVIDSTQPFKIRGVMPRPNQVGVEAEAKVAVRFTTPFDPRSVGEGAVRVEDEHGRRFPGEIRMVARDTTLVLTPYEPFPPGVVLRVAVSDQVRAAKGSPLEGKRSWRFRTSRTGSLSVVRVEPEDKVLETDSAITVVFDRPVDTDTLRAGDLVLEGAGVEHSGSIVWDETSTIMIFAPHVRLAPGTDYQLHLPVGLSDREGKGMEDATPLAFRTRAQGSGPDHSRSLDHLGSGRAGVGDLARMFDSGSGRGPGPGAVPQWVLPSFLALKQKGYLPVDITRTLTRRSVLTRHRAAMIVEGARKRLGGMSRAERLVVQKLEQEFGRELASMGHEVAAVPRATGIASL